MTITKSNPSNEAHPQAFIEAAQREEIKALIASSLVEFDPEDYRDEHTRSLLMAQHLMKHFHILPKTEIESKIY